MVHIGLGLHERHQSTTTILVAVTLFLGVLGDERVVVVLVLTFGRKPLSFGHVRVFLRSFPCSFAAVVLYLVAVPQGFGIRVSFVEQPVKTVPVFLTGHGGSSRLKMFGHVLDGVRVFPRCTRTAQSATCVGVLAGQPLYQPLPLFRGDADREPGDGRDDLVEVCFRRSGHRLPGSFRLCPEFDALDNVLVVVEDFHLYAVFDTVEQPLRILRNPQGFRSICHLREKESLAVLVRHLVDASSVGVNSLHAYLPWASPAKWHIISGNGLFGKYFCTAAALLGRGQIRNGLLHHELGFFAIAFDLGSGFQGFDTIEHVVGFGSIEELLHVFIEVSTSTKQRGVELRDKLLCVSHSVPVEAGNTTVIGFGTRVVQVEELIRHAPEERFVLLGQNFIEEVGSFSLHVDPHLAGGSEVRQQ